MAQLVPLSSFISEVARKARKQLTVPLQETANGFGATEDLRAPVSAEDIVFNAGFTPGTTKLKKVDGDGFCFFNSLAASMHGNWTPEAIRLLMKSSAEDRVSYEAVRLRIVSDGHPNIAQDEFKDWLMDYGQSEHNLFVKSLQSRVAQKDWPDQRHAVYAAFLLQREITVLCVDFSLAAQAYGCPRIWKFNPDAQRGAGLVKVKNHFDAIISDTFVQTPPPVQSVPSQSRAPSAPPVAPQQQLGIAERAVVQKNGVLEGVAPAVLNWTTVLSTATENNGVLDLVAQTLFSWIAFFSTKEQQIKAEAAQQIEDDARYAERCEQRYKQEDDDFDAALKLQEAEFYS